MKRITFRRWVQACLVSSAVAGGCNRQEVPLARNDSDMLTPVGAWAQRDPKAMSSIARRTESPIVPASYTMPEPMPTTAQASMRAASIPPVVVADPPEAASAPVSSQTPIMPNPLSPATMAAAAPVRLHGEKSTGQDEVAMAMGRYGHAPDYSWLCGEVQHTRRGWHLRYASMDESDPHGGSVMLNDDGHLSDLKDGDIILVKGRLQDPDSRSTAPVYVVSDVKPQR